MQYEFLRKKEKWHTASFKLILLWSAIFMKSITEMVFCRTHFRESCPGGIAKPLVFGF